MFNIELVQFLVFGFVDNFFLLIGALFGLSLDNLYKGKGKGTGTVIGALIGNSISDGLAGLVAINMPLAVGSFLGCLIPLAGYLLYVKCRRIA